MTDLDRRDRVEAALRAVVDPSLDVNVFEAGLIEAIRIEGDRVTIEADLSDFGDRGADEVMRAMMEAAGSVEGVASAHVEHAAPDPSGRDVGIEGIGRVIAVASAKGGVGKTTVAANLACALADTEPVGLFDADVYGPNVPALLEVEGPVYSDDEGRPLPVDAGGLEVMSVGLMEEGAPLAWRGAMAHDALTELFEDTAWRGRDTLVIDLPPGTGDIVLTTLQEVRVDGVVMVTTPFNAAVTDTARSIELFRENDVPVLGIVSNMATFACPSCGDAHDLFPDGSPLDELAVSVLAELPFDPAVQDTPRPGHVEPGFVDLADAVRDRLAAIWDPELPEDALDLRGVAPEDRHDRVEAAFSALEPGERFALVSDRDPRPVVGFLEELAGIADGEPALEPVQVSQLNPGTWVLETEYP